VITSWSRGMKKQRTSPAAAKAAPTGITLLISITMNDCCTVALMATVKKERPATIQP
jgi:hypothetical protein